MRQLRSALAATAVAWVVRLPAVPSVLAANHTIFTANRNAPAQVHMLAFDDAALRLSLVRSLPGDTTHTWLSLSVSRPLNVRCQLQVLV